MKCQFSWSFSFSLLARLFKERANTSSRWEAKLNFYYVHVYSLLCHCNHHHHQILKAKIPSYRWHGCHLMPAFATTTAQLHFTVHNDTNEISFYGFSQKFLVRNSFCCCCSVVITLFEFIQCQFTSMFAKDAPVMENVKLCVHHQHSVNLNRENSTGTTKYDWRIALTRILIKLIKKFSPSISIPRKWH